jgi:hypothetical protein
MWSLLSPGVLVALSSVAPSDGAPPPGAHVACTEVEQRVAGTLRRARSNSTLPIEDLAAEIAALGPAVLRPCLDTLERERVALVVPGDRVQKLSDPQREILLRALGGLPHEAVLRAALERTELSHETAARRLTLDVLGVAGSAEHLPRLREIGLIDGEEAPPRLVSKAFQGALAGILERDPSAYTALAGFLRDAPAALSGAIVGAVGDAGLPQGLSFLEHVASFRPEHLALCANQVRLIGRSGDLELDRELAQRLRWAVNPERPETCGALLLALGELRDYEAVPLLIEILASADAGLSGNALWALRRITDLNFPALPERWSAWYESELVWFTREQDFVLRDLHSGSPSAAAAAARTISERRLWREELALELMAALQRPHPTLRAPICRALERLGVDSVAPELVELLDDEDPASVQAAWRTLTALTGRELPADAMTWRLALASDS